MKTVFINNAVGAIKSAFYCKTVDAAGWERRDHVDGKNAVNRIRAEDAKPNP